MRWIDVSVNNALLVKGPHGVGKIRNELGGRSSRPEL